MDTLIRQEDLKEYDSLAVRLDTLAHDRAALMTKPEFVAISDEEAKIAERRKVLDAKFVAAADKARKLGVKVVEKGKSKLPDLKPVTESGPFFVEVAYGTADSTAWKKVVEAIKAKDCSYLNGGGTMHPLNSILTQLILAQTETSSHTRVKVEAEPIKR
jgi:hypothetical protein